MNLVFSADCFKNTMKILVRWLITKLTDERKSGVARVFFGFKL